MEGRTSAADRPSSSGERSPARRRVEPSPPEPAADESLADEVRLLSSLRRASTASPAEAIRLADEHQRRFGEHAPLMPERELYRVRALVRLGRNAEAEARVARFRARRPSSPYLSRLERLLE